MTTLQYQLSRMTERKKKLMTQASARTDGSEPTFCLSPKMDPGSYSNAFNNYLVKLKDSEYKTKNPKMFIWKQKMQYMNKLNLPSQLTNNRNTSAFSSLRGGHQNDQSQDKIRSAKALTRSNTRHIPRDFIKTEVSTVESDAPYTATPKMRRPQKHLELDMNTLHSFYTTTQYSSKSTYPTTKVQTELLSNRFSPQLQSIPNFKYMLNPFDRKNLPLNKALSQMTTDNELLNREEIQQETWSKIAYVSKHHKLRRVLKPKISRPKIIIAKTETTARQSPFIRLNSMNMNESINKTRSTPKYDALITEPSSRRFNESPPLLLFSNADEVKMKSAKLARKDRKQNTVIQRERSFRDQDSSPKSKGDTRLVKFPEKEKSLLFNVESGLHYFEELSSLREVESKENRLQPHGHEKKKSLKQSMSRDKTKEDEHIRMLTDEVGDDNIYFFGKYFKKRYMENGVRFDVSPNLQSRIKNLNYGLKHSIRTIETIDFRDEGV